MNIQTILYMLPAVLIGLTIHEFAHALAAVKSGDMLPRDQGRLSLNPLVHIDLLGFVLLIVAGFGWAKPVQTNPGAYRHPRRDSIVVALAGVVTNFLAAVLFTIVFKLITIFAPGFLSTAAAGDVVSRVLSYSIWINLVLCFFNLLPLPPLDGSHLVTVFIPGARPDLRRWYERGGVIVLVALILVSRYTDFNVLPVGSVVGAVFGWLAGVFSLG